GLKSPATQKDLLTLVNLWQDAQLVCMEVKEENLAAAKEKAAELFRASDLFQNLSREHGGREPSGDAEAKQIGETQDMTLEVRVGGFDRTIHLRVAKQKDSPV